MISFSKIFLPKEVAREVAFKNTPTDKLPADKSQKPLETTLTASNPEGGEAREAKFVSLILNKVLEGKNPDRPT